MALFIQHGALRNSEDYFCSFKKLMLQQRYRDFDDVIIVAPDVSTMDEQRRQKKGDRADAFVPRGANLLLHLDVCSLIMKTMNWSTHRMPFGTAPNRGAIGG